MIVLVVAVVVIAVLVTFVLPAYTKLFATFGADLPTITKILMNGSDWAAKYGIYVMLIILVAVMAGFMYTKTEKGAVRWDGISLRMPVLGQINLLNQLSYSSRIMALLFRVGLRPPDVVSLAVDGSMNRVVKQSLLEVREEMIRGEDCPGRCRGGRCFYH